MDFLIDLWLPILLAAVFVFIVSSILHMVLPIHKGDYLKLPGEGKVLEEMRTQGVPPGGYMFPCAGSMKEMATPEMMEKYKKGPVGFLTVVPSGVPAMTKNLIQWFLYSVVVGVVVAYVARLGLSQGAAYMEVFRMTGSVAILGYAVSHIPDSIWKGLSWRTTLKFIFDGIVYGLVTAGTFGWLWPGA
ncbi:MAG: hypothetical protein ACE5JX_04460 [Acidobacteriota bacterium]